MFNFWCKQSITFFTKERFPKTKKLFLRKKEEGGRAIPPTTEVAGLIALIYESWN